MFSTTGIACSKATGSVIFEVDDTKELSHLRWLFCIPWEEGHSLSKFLALLCHIYSFLENLIWSILLELADDLLRDG